MTESCNFDKIKRIFQRGRNLWILTEERPKYDVVKTILNEYSKDESKELTGVDDLKIELEIIEKKFTFRYIIKGVRIDGIDNIFLKIVSGDGSFVDYLVYRSKKEPKLETDSPIYLIEETKTIPDEARDLFVQRLTKFVTCNFNPNFKKSKQIMLFSFQKDIDGVTEKLVKWATQATKTMGVKVLGFGLSENWPSFENMEQMAKQKNDFALSFVKKDGTPSKQGIPMRIDIKEKVVEISSRLQKGKPKVNGKSDDWSDPAVGFASGSAFLVRKFGWKKKIEVVNHKFTKLPDDSEHKFIKICSELDISIKGVTTPSYSGGSDYFKETKGEKLCSIFLHMALIYNNSVEIIFEQHAGCEKSYFKTKETKPLDLLQVKTGKTRIPDMILFDEKNNEMLILEAEKFENVEKGIKQLDDFDNIENNYCKNWYGRKNIPDNNPEYYAPYCCGICCRKFVIVYGDGEITSEQKDHVIFQLKTDGTMITYDKCPQSIKDVISKLQK